jgi:hypothetical protein
LTVSGGQSLTRVLFRGHSAQDTILTGASIQQRADVTEDYSINPVRLTFNNGNESVTISGGIDKWSDWVSFTLDPNIDHLIHVFQGQAPHFYKFKTKSSATYVLQSGIDNTMTVSISASGYNLDSKHYHVVAIDTSSSSSSSSSSVSSSSESSSSSSSSESCYLEVDDNFDGSNGDLLNVHRWEYPYEVNSPVINNNKALTVASAGQIIDGVRSRFSLAGNFEIQIDWSETLGPDTDNWNGVFRVISTSGDSFFGITRSYSTPSGNYYSVIEKEEGQLNSPVVSATSDTGTSFKLIRTNNNLMTAQLWNGQKWATIKQGNWVGGDIDVEFYMSCSGSFPTVSFEWDNFTAVSYDEVICAVSSSSSSSSSSVSSSSESSSSSSSSESSSSSSSSESSSSSSSSESSSSSSSSESSSSSSSSSSESSSSSSSSESCFVTPFFDSFDGDNGDPPDGQRWAYIQNPSNSDIQDNKLNFTIPSGSSGATNLTRLDLRADIEGNFDLQIDYDVNPLELPSGSGDNFMRIEVVRASDLTQLGNICRLKNQIVNGYESNGLDVVSSAYNRGDNGGALRITRFNGLIKVFIWSGSQWEYDGNTDGRVVANNDTNDVNIWLLVQTQDNSGLTGNFNNWQINSADGVTCPGSSSSSSSSLSSSSESSSSSVSLSSSSSSESIQQIQTTWFGVSGETIDEDLALAYSGNWTVNNLTLSGSGLTEIIRNNCPEVSGSAISDPFFVGLIHAAVDTNKYLGTPWPVGLLVQYRTGFTSESLATSGWNNYDKYIGFESKGWIQFKTVLSTGYSSSSSSYSSSSSSSVSSSSTSTAPVSAARYYYSNHDTGTEWAFTPEQMVDGSIGTLAGAIAADSTQLCNAVTLSNGSATGTISKVEIRAYADRVGTPIGFDLRPLFNGSSDGDLHDLIASLGIYPPSSWSDWLEITDDTNSPGTWEWSDITNMDMNIIFLRNAADGPNDVVRCYKIEILVWVE